MIILLELLIGILNITVFVGVGGGVRVGGKVLVGDTRTVLVGVGVKDGVKVIVAVPVGPQIAPRILVSDPLGNGR